jgi:hypothetical protein
VLKLNRTCCRARRLDVPRSFRKDRSCEKNRVGLGKYMHLFLLCVDGWVCEVNNVHWTGWFEVVMWSTGALGGLLNMTFLLY